MKYNIGTVYTNTLDYDNVIPYLSGEMNEADTIEIGDGTKIIPKYAFYKIKATDIKLPNTIKRIESSAFTHLNANDRVKTYINIPKGIEYIHPSAFRANNNYGTQLSNILRFDGTADEWNAKGITFTVDYCQVIYVYDSEGNQIVSYT